MACSVYCAQHLLDALYGCGEADYAMSLLTATHDRSWYHMIEAGSTMTWEAWDWRYKNNLDWNHAWGAAPANIIMRRVMGVRPLSAGFDQVLIQPQPGALRSAAAKVPTCRGPIQISFENEPGQDFILRVTIPENMTARVGLPDDEGTSVRMIVDGKPHVGQREGCHLYVDDIGPGSHEISLLPPAILRRG
jgi:hypothetical protein